MGEPHEEFTAWYRLFWPRLVGSVTVMTGDPDVANEVAAEALSRLWPRWGNGKVADPEAWTYRVAANLAKRRGRRISMERSLLRALPMMTDHHDPVPSPELWREVRALPSRQRTVIALRYVADMTQQQIADVLGVAPGTVASALHDARSRLREVLTDDDGGVDHLDEAATTAYAGGECDG